MLGGQARILLISKDNEMDNGRYRRGFDEFIMI